LTANGLSPGDVLAGHDGYGLVSFTAGFARKKHRQNVATLPHVKNEPAHAFIVGHKTDGIRKAFAKEATVLVAARETSSG
jgi:hypothetical protein